jgi:hypothetical protein
MFGWLWGCMVLSLKLTIGGLCWLFVIAIVCLLIGAIGDMLDR